MLIYNLKNSCKIIYLSDQLGLCIACSTKCFIFYRM